jgi:kumamolisin
MRRFGFSGAFGSGPRGSRPQFRAVPGSELAPLPGAYVVGRPNPARRIQVSVLLRPQSQSPQLVSLDELSTILPQQRHYLTREAFAAAHGAAPADVQRVVRFARRFGLQVVGQKVAARTVHLSGTISSFSRAFRVPLFIYRYAHGRYRGGTGPIHVPVALEGIVQGVFGLDNRRVAKPHFRRRRELAGVWAHAAGVSYSPPEVASLYQFPKGVDGSGQCIGIIELGGGFRPADLRQYFSKLGVPRPQVTAVSVAGGGNRPTGNPNSADGEVMLDIEVAGAVASGAKIVVYFAPNTGQGFLRAVNRAIHDKRHRPSVISISWGSPEASWAQQALTAFDQAFQAAASMGISVCVATGDGGSSDGVPGKLAYVDFPASSPYVLACGGTSVHASGGTIISESVWNDGPQGGAGGGGISDFFAKPSYQSGVAVPPSVNPGGHVGRGLPDLAADADENTGYQVRVDGVDTVIGGTSAVAPLTAGLIALLNQAMAANVGYLNPLLYTKFGKTAAFHDITQGNNDMTGQVGGYKAGPGWDACSGFGSPRGSALLAELQPPAHQASTTHSAAPPVDTQIANGDKAAPPGSDASGEPKPVKKKV